MRVSRVLMMAGVAFVATMALTVAVSAQTKTDEDFTKLMKGVGAAQGAMRKATEPDAIAAESKKLEALFKDAGAFWTAHGNKEAADWSTAAMNQAAAITKAAGAKSTDGIAAAQKDLGGSCQTCHAKYREKTDTGYAIKKG